MKREGCTTRNSNTSQKKKKKRTVRNQKEDR